MIQLIAVNISALHWLCQHFCSCNKGPQKALYTHFTVIYMHTPIFELNCDNGEYRPLEDAKSQITFESGLKTRNCIWDVGLYRATKEDRIGKNNRNKNACYL